MTSKMRIKMGEVEVDFEGSEEFLKEELQNVLEAVVALHQATPRAASNGSPSNGQSTLPSDGGHSLGETMTTHAIAAKLKSSSGPELVKAAALGLTLAGSSKFTRRQLLSEMQSATTFFTESYRKNLSVAIESLVKSNVLKPQGTDTYALSHSSLNELKPRLAD